MTNPQLSVALQNSSLHVLLLILSKALSRSGYGDVQILDRRLPKQKSRHGGHELLCEATLAGRTVRVVVKVLRDSVRIRNLDELAGTVIRMKADSGLIVSPFHVTAQAKKLLSIHNPVRLWVLDGDQLAQLLAELGIGTRGRGDVDYAYFGAMEEMSDRVLGMLSHLAA